MVMEFQVEMEVWVPAARMKFLVLTMMEVLAPFGSGGHVDEVLGASGNDRGWRYWLWKMVVAAGGGGDRIIAWQTVVVE